MQLQGIKCTATSSVTLSYLLLEFVAHLIMWWLIHSSGPRPLLS